MGRVESFPGEVEPEVIRAEGDTVTISDVHLLFSGDFSRSGADLIIAGEGKLVFVADYFGDAGMPALAAPNGALLLPNVVSALAGPLAPGQYVQADDLQAEEGIGRIVTLTGSATAQRGDGSVVELGVDSRVAEGDVVQTGSGSALGIVFDDGTVFNLNSDSRMVLNELVYEPGGGSNSMLFSVVQGVFAFVAGQVAATGEMRIDTPVATMGVRGTSCLGVLDGVAVFRVIPDPVTNRVGACVLYSLGTDIVLAVSDSLETQLAFNPATGQMVEQLTDPAHEDIIQRLHDTFIRFTDLPTEQEDTQQAGETGGPRIETQFSIVSDPAVIVDLAGGAFGESEPLPQNFFNMVGLFGGMGDDVLVAEGGLVVLRGGPGNDVLTSTDEGNYWDFVRVDYSSSASGIIANLTAGPIGILQSGEVMDGFGSIDTISRVHVLADSSFDDVVYVDSSYVNSFGNWIEVRLSGGNDEVYFDGVATARISYTQAGGPVLLDLETGMATDLDPGDNFIGIDRFVGANEGRGSHFGDTIFGRIAANDILIGSGGDDTIDGRGGTNRIGFNDSSSGIHVDLSQSLVLNDGIFISSLGRNGIDTLINVQNVRGSHWDDHIIGDSGDNILYGGRGNDTLAGGLGNDILIGGGGADRLEYRSPDEGGDAIIGFAVSEDVLVIDATAFGGGLVGGGPLPASKFVAGQSPQATQAEGQFLYDTSNGDLLWDSDGTGEFAPVYIANLVGAPVLTESDFEIVADIIAHGMSEVAAAVDAGSEPVA